MTKIKLYIASPYTNGWMPDNVRLQLEAKDILMNYGFVPFAPLVNHFSEIYKHRKENEWLEWDIEWLKTCDILVRIRSKRNGLEIPSPGSDKETLTARENNILIVELETLEELELWAKNFKYKSKEELNNE